MPFVFNGITPRTLSSEGLAGDINTRHRIAGLPHEGALWCLLNHHFLEAATAPQHLNKRIETMYFEAIFEPSETMEYDPEAKDLAGEKIAIQEGWIIKEGPFKGQLCFYIPNSTIGWIPKSDLKELKPVPFVRWKEIHKQSGYGS